MIRKNCFVLLFIVLAVFAVLLVGGCANLNGEAPGGASATTAAPGSSATPETPGTPGIPSSATPEVPTPTPLPLAGVKICIDAGHQRVANLGKEALAPWDSTLKTKVATGTQGVSTGIPEYEINLQIALKLKAALSALGADLLMIRETNDVDISNVERALMANDYGVDITLRIHCNGATATSANGIEIYVRDKGDGSAEYSQRSATDYALGQALLSAIINQTGANNRGVKKSDAYSGTNWCESPCLIVECGFMSNVDEDIKLSTPEYQDKIVAGFVDFFLTRRA